MEVDSNAVETVRPRLSRLQATGMLAATGVGTGFVLGTAILAAIQVRAPGGFNWAVDIPFGMLLGGTFGAVVGGIGAPLLSWALLRHVPLGRAIAVSAVATVAGAALGLLAGHPAIGGCLGFGIGALGLRLTHRPPTA